MEWGRAVQGMEEGIAGNVVWQNMELLSVELKGALKGMCRRHVTPSQNTECAGQFRECPRAVQGMEEGSTGNVV
eukprot:1289883-Rhodomonas_salina.1